MDSINTADRLTSDRHKEPNAINGCWDEGSPPLILTDREFNAASTARSGQIGRAYADDRTYERTFISAVRSVTASHPDNQRRRTED